MNVGTRHRVGSAALEKRCRPAGRRFDSLPYLASRADFRDSSAVRSRHAQLIAASILGLTGRGVYRTYARGELTLETGPRSDGFKELEIVVPQQELSVVRRQAGRPQLRPSDRLFLEAAGRLLPQGVLAFFRRDPDDAPSLAPAAGRSPLDLRQPHGPTRLSPSARSRARRASGLPKSVSA